MKRIILILVCLSSFNGCAGLQALDYVCSGITLIKALPSAPTSTNTVYVKSDVLKNLNGSPNNIVKVDSNSEVWEYYNVPNNGNVRVFAFTGEELTNSGNVEMGKNKTRIEYINFFPCYEHLRMDAITGATPPLPCAVTPQLSNSSTVGL